MHGCSDKHTLTVWCGLLAVVQPTQLATDLVCATRTGLCVVQLQLPARQTSSSSSSSTTQEWVVWLFGCGGVTGS